MWSVRVELVGPDGKAALANEYSYETAESATECSLDVFELLAESDHVSEFTAGQQFENS
jgi:hypothetical protein